MNITASALPRVAACPGSAALAKAHLANENAAAGNDRHFEMEEAGLEGRIEDLPLKVQELIEPGAQLHPEIAIAYNWRTGVGRLIGRGTARAYDVTADEIPGTIDLLIVGSRLIVVDYKGFEYVGSPEQHEQANLYALAVARIYGFNEVTIAIVYIGAGVEHAHADVITIDCFEMATYSVRLTRIMEAVEAAERQPIPEVRESKHCKWCPSKPFCSAKNALLVQVAENGLAIVGDSIMTTERARAAYEQIERIDSLLREAKKRLEVYVEEQGPIDLGNGRMYGRYQRKGNEKVDGPIAVQAIREVLVAPENQAEFEKVAIVPTATKASIERAAKAVTSTMKPTALAKAVIAKIRELGGISSSPTFPVGEYVRGKDEPAEKPEIDAGEIDRLLTSAG